MFRTSTDSYGKRLFAAFLITLALYSIAGAAFALLPKVAIFLSTGSGGSGGGNGLIILGVESGSGSSSGTDTGSAAPGGAEGTNVLDRKDSPQTVIPSPSGAVSDDAQNALVAETIATADEGSRLIEPDKLVANGSEESEATGATSAGNESVMVGTGEGGTGGGIGFGGSFVGATGDATTTPFISWIDRSIRRRLYYPEKARLRNLEGTVTLGMAVPADGSRCEVVLAKSSGHDVLDYAAINLLRSLFPSKVAPGRDFSAPVRIRYTLVGN